MKTIIEGENIENRFGINTKQKVIKDKDGKDSIVYTAKPELVKKVIAMGYETLCEYEGAPHYNSKNAIFNFYDSLNIAEDETVAVKEEIFRADKNEMHIRTNKICSERDVNKRYCEGIYKGHITLFNKAMIKSNDKMKSYCKLHKLKPKDTDCAELFKLLYPDCEYEIVDGVMREKKSELSESLEGIEKIKRYKRTVF